MKPLYFSIEYRASCSAAGDAAAGDAADDGMLERDFVAEVKQACDPRVRPAPATPAAELSVAGSYSVQTGRTSKYVRFKT